MKILKATVSGATVYRTIKAFKELGQVSRKVQVWKKIVGHCLEKKRITEKLRTNPT
ncbi:Hypothetical protein FKW44_006695 [Caligus rogercresseyi]|uniref:Uncharacterized protein n=1 Tax=Caligus rogercresseyi TaxID=217165 RepID=A0A7T8KDP6_CALRO|nr:Hypothetical protein FKW44_006695 [Caligus rogercresseyi]